ncbi:MAG: pullulanase-type alpha-1,6-glucosidase [Acidiferrobacterales bacterium]|nr:pullulanase-type alpha-1,6-glucosidase [Acidiferrobacterales bacterium]
MNYSQLTQAHSVLKLNLIFAFSLLIFCLFPTKGLARSLSPLEQLSLIDNAAHWVDYDTILLPENTSILNPTLIGYSKGLNHSTEQEVSRVSLSSVKLSDDLAQKYPHLKNHRAFTFDLKREAIRKLLKSQLFIADQKNEPYKLHGVQTAEAIDAIFTSGKDDANEVSDLGASIGKDSAMFKLWAPTARNVTLLLFDKDFRLTKEVKMTEDPKSGVWSTVIKRARNTQNDDSLYYQYQLNLLHYSTGVVTTVTTSDPYSLGLSANGQHSLIVDLNDAKTKPKGWDQHQAPQLERPEQQIIYEAHIGDFSAGSKDIAAQDRAKYRAFQYQKSAPMQHLRKMVEAGLNTFHLLPTYDIGTIDEDETNRVTLQSTVKKACRLIEQQASFCKSEDHSSTLEEVLSSYSVDSSKAQELIEAINEIDDYNWGYDPVHYTVPEGSYASNANGLHRILEFRKMVQILHDMGLRVVMDVVYNHTYEAGLNHHSVLDKIVPGYYHRLDPVSGQIEQSTCCENTATERVMMAKLMTDSLVIWSQHYKIDGFRFDLMGHQPKSVMLDAREKVRKVDPDTYFYGEGWNFGEVANNAQFVQATQTEMNGTSIGTFNDRLRDAIRGGSSFVDGDALRIGQGLGNGQLVDPNDLVSEGNESLIADYDRNIALTRLGLAGNLQRYEIESRDGTILRGDEVPYGDSSAGYASDPADTVNYVSKHDNQTLWDNNQYRMPYEFSPETRARLQVQGLSYPLLGQGIPFLHMGGELGRSKSFLRDSYNFGHWFNQVDFTYKSNNYNVGLPPAIKDKNNWEIIRRVLRNNAGKDTLTEKHIRFINEGFLDLLAIRSSSALFTLPTSAEIQKRVQFLNTGPEQKNGLIAMSIDDGYSNVDIKDLDPLFSQILVMINHGPAPITFNYSNAQGLDLHPRQKQSLDKALLELSIKSNSITTPAYTTAVLVRTQDE